MPPVRAVNLHREVRGATRGLPPLPRRVAGPTPSDWNRLADKGGTFGHEHQIAVGQPLDGTGLLLASTTRDP